MEKEKKITKWIHLFLPSLILAMTGTVFYGFVSGCRFMGILLWGLALICGVYGFLGIWKRWKAARIAAGSLSLVLALVLVAAVITLIPILQGPGETGENGEYVIVLGAGVRGTEPSEILADRIQMAARYLQEHPDVICIASGGMGSRIAERFSGSIKVNRLGVSETPVQQATVDEQDMLCGMDCESLKKAIYNAAEEIK